MYKVDRRTERQGFQNFCFSFQQHHELSFQSFPATKIKTIPSVFYRTLLEPNLNFCLFS